MWLCALLFFGSLPITAILLIVAIFSPSAGQAKATGLFFVLTITGLLGMVGLNILERFTTLKKMEDGPKPPYVP